MFNANFIAFVALLYLFVIYGRFINMRKIQDTVRETLFADEEALYALSKNFMNLSAYAKLIHKQIEKRTTKDVKPTGIVVALSRIQRELGKIHPLVQDVVIKNITTKSPLSEIVFEKREPLLQKLSSFYAHVKTGNDDFLSMILSTTEITILCSDRITEKVLSHFADNPQLLRHNLASIGLSFDQKYSDMPNITYSLLRKIAQKRISLTETITTHTEIIFVFDQKRLAEVVGLFQDPDSCNLISLAIKNAILRATKYRRR